MIKDRLLLENLEYGVPATWHRNTLSTFASTRPGFENVATRIPTQLVYPNGSFNIGVVVESLGNFNSPLLSQGPMGQQQQDTPAGSQPLIIYASAKPSRWRNQLVEHYPACISFIVYVLLALVLGSRIKADVGGSVFVKLMWFTVICNGLNLFLLWRFGWAEALRVNCLLLLLLLCLKVLNVGNIYMAIMAIKHLFCLVSNMHCLHKKTPKVFTISDH